MKLHEEYEDTPYKWYRPDEVDEYIVNQISDKDINEYIGKPSDIYESKYVDLEKFEEKVLDEVTVDFNVYVTSQKNILSPTVINAVSKLLPARSRIDEVGVVLKPHLLQRTKLKNHQLQLKSGSAAGDFTLNSINVPSSSMSESVSFIFPYSSSLYPASGTISGLPIAP